MPFCTSEAKKAAGVKCCAIGCSNKPEAKLGGLCHKHYRRKRRAVDPVGVRYNQMKGKAKSRNKTVSVTLAEFREFCQDTGYILVKGRRGRNATLDRIINTEGYIKGNLQLLTNKQNIDKYYNSDRWADLLAQCENEDLPF